MSFRRARAADSLWPDPEYYFPRESDARALAIVAPLTSQIRGLRGEFFLGKQRWLPKISAINIQGLASFHVAKLARPMGELSQQQFAEAKAALRELLGL